MRIRLIRLHRPAADDPGPISTSGPGDLLLTSLWFGLVAGWLELGLTLVLRVVDPHVSDDVILTSRHFVWMIPVSVVAYFSVVGVVMALFATIRSVLARWVAWRLLVTLTALSLLFSVERLHVIASVILAVGLGLRVGPWFERRSVGIGRWVRASLPALGVGLFALCGVGYERIETAERRALVQRAPAKPGAPNVMLIVLDTVRAQCLSLHGHQRPTSPNLDRLARRGLVFTEARATAPWTTPTHASLMTGRWPHELSARPGVPLDATFPTLAEVLGQEGYATAGFVGNVYYCNAAYGFDRGFARYEDAYENQSVTPRAILRSSGLGRRLNQLLGMSKSLEQGDVLTRKTAAMLNRDVLGWLAGRPADRPFFVFLNYYDAHRPYYFPDDPTPRFGMAGLPTAEQNEIDRRFVDLTSQAFPANPGAQFVAEGRQIASDAFHLYHDCYDSCIAYLDRQLGLLFDEMERRGLLENTLVVLTSDHGEQIGERGQIAHGTSVHRSEVHVPLVVIAPAKSSRVGVINEPVSLRDIPATIAEFAAPDRHAPFPGRSLTRFLEEDLERRAEGSPVFSELQHNIAYPETGDQPSPFRVQRSLVSRGLVYIVSDDGREELYDLANDPWETNDLAQLPRSSAVLLRFREELAQIYRDSDQERKANDDDDDGPTPSALLVREFSVRNRGVGGSVE